MTGISAAEVSVQRELTGAFIAADSVEIVLYRATPQDDGAGGYLPGTPAPLPVQVMRLIPAGDGAQERFTAEGKAVRPDYMLMGEHDADMERGDSFSLDGNRYEIVFVNQNRQYQVKGQVVYHGR